MPIEFILDICRTSELGLQFGRPTVAQPGQQYNVHHFNFGLGKFYGHHMDVYESWVWVGSEGAPGSGCGVGPDRRSVLQGQSTCLQCCVPWVLLSTI